MTVTLKICTLALTCNGPFDEKVGDQTGVGQQGLGDRGGGVVLQPVLHGGPLVCVPVCSYHRLHHHCLSLTVPEAAGSGASFFMLPLTAGAG